MRQTLSKTPYGTGIVFLLIPVVFIGFALYATITEGFDDVFIVLFLFTGIFGVVGVNIFTRIKSVEFDDSHMYILSRHGEVDVPFKNIKRAVITGTRINRWKVWKIEYRDDLGQEQRIRFYPRGYVKEMDEFFTRVWESNPEVEIDVWIPPDKRTD